MRQGDASGKERARGRGGAHREDVRLRRRQPLALAHLEAAHRGKCQRAAALPISNVEVHVYYEVLN